MKILEHMQVWFYPAGDGEAQDGLIRAMMARTGHVPDVLCVASQTDRGVEHIPPTDEGLARLLTLIEGDMGALEEIFSGGKIHDGIYVDFLLPSGAKPEVNPPVSRDDWGKGGDATAEEQAPNDEPELKLPKKRRKGEEPEPPPSE